MNWFLLGAAGMAGVFLRAGASIWWSGAFWATLSVNVLGCFLMGILVSTQKFSDWRPLIAIGFLGGLTTFSGFILDLYKFIQHQQWVALVGYFLLTHILCLLFFAVGLQLGPRI